MFSSFKTASFSLGSYIELRRSFLASMGLFVLDELRKTSKHTHRTKKVKKVLNKLVLTFCKHDQNYTFAFIVQHSKS